MIYESWFDRLWEQFRGKGTESWLVKEKQHGT